MRTTLSISDELLEAARRTARERGQTLGQVVETALRRDFTDPNEERPGPPIPVFRGGSGPRAHIDLSSNRALAEALDEGLDLNELR